MRHFLFFTPRSWAVLLCSTVAMLFSAASFADPPARVARLAQIGGTVSFSPAGEQDWEIAQANRPVTTGDRLWADAGSHAELQIGAVAARLGPNTAVTILNLDDRIGQFQLAQGALNVRVRDITGDQFYEIDTPNLAFSIRRVGDYRIDVDPDGNASIIQVRSGEGEAWGEGAAYTIDAGQQYTFAGEGMRDVRYDALPPTDEFDRWCFDRNRREDAAIAARYVPRDMVGYSDLDEYGTWRNVEGYGTVWVPTQVAADWVPYHYGHWGWIDPWGWTWIDDAPWGFAPFHYGRWAFVSSRWCWVPGPIAVHPVYSPALVAFVGGGGFSLSVSSGPVAGVAWFPLGVGEVYVPSYTVSRTYFTNINVTNTVINTTYVTNVYNNPSVQVNYRNREVTNAITAVPATAFASGERVERHAVAVQRDVIARQPVAHVAAVTPTHASVFAAAAVAGGAAAVAAAHRPPERVVTRQVVARTQPPAPPPSFAARSQLLSSQPGRPLDTEKMRSIRTERAAEAPRVKMVSPSVTPRPLDKGVAKAGPGTAPGGQAQEERAARERRAGPQAGGPQPGGPQAGAPQPPPQAQERFKGEERLKGGQPPGAATAEEERAMRERRAGTPQGAPQAGGVPQPPPQAQERFKGEERAKAGQPPGAATAEQERTMRERRAGGGGPPPGAQGGPPPQAQERARGGPPPGAATAEQERAMRERSAGGGGPPPGGQPQEERGTRERREGGQPGAGPQAGSPPQTQERMRGAPPQGAQAQQERAQQERAQQERAQQQQQSQQRAQQERAQQERAQQQQQQSQQRMQQERAQQERTQQQSQQRAQQERAQQQAQQQQQQQAQQRAQQERAQQQAQAQQQRAEQERGQQRGPQGRGQQEKEKEKEKEQRGQQQ